MKPGSHSPGSYYLLSANNIHVDTLQLIFYRADFVEVEGSLGGVADNEDKDDGGEDSGHGVVPPGDGGDHMESIMCTLPVCTIMGDLLDLFKACDTDTARKLIRNERMFLNV